MYITKKLITILFSTIMIFPLLCVAKDHSMSASLINSSDEYYLIAVPQEGAVFAVGHPINEVISTFPDEKIKPSGRTVLGVLSNKYWNENNSAWVKYHIYKQSNNDYVETVIFKFGPKIGASMEIAGKTYQCSDYACRLPSHL